MAFQELARSAGLLLARISLAAIFLYGGFQNASRVPEIAASLGTMHYPKPMLLAVIAVAAALLGGVSILFGAITALGCVALLCFLVPATYSFHFIAARAGDVGQLIEVLKNLGLMGGLLALLCAGPGALSVDRRLFKWGGK